MFTGLVEQLGSVRSFRPVAFGAELVVDPRGWAHTPAPGESIAVNGCCLTVAAIVPLDHPDERGLRFDVIRQTLDTTNLGRLQAGDPVNLEHAASPTTLLGGHIVQGHVDGVAMVRRVQRDETEWRVRIEPPASMLDAIVAKGSVAVDGVSLTIATLLDDAFEVALIPTTLERTTLGRLDEGSVVNIETDYVAKTVVHWLSRQRIKLEGDDAG